MGYPNISEVSKSFEGRRIMVLGDAMLDHYIHGTVERESPEAPVPVVLQRDTDIQPGGAANVALNLQALGAVPYLVTVVGSDASGDQLLSLMTDAGLSTQFVHVDASRPTTEKVRVFNGQEQIVRIDNEITQPIGGPIRNQLVEWAVGALPQMDAFIFQDYDKGVIGKELLAPLMTACRKEEVPVISDPKERNFFNFDGCTIFKPNLREFESAFELKLNLGDQSSLEQIMVKARQQLGCGMLLVTLSSHGLAMVSSKGFERIPAESITALDVSGAGDTVAAAATLALIAGLDPHTIGCLSNLAGACACEQMGVTPVTVDQLIKKR